MGGTCEFASLKPESWRAYELETCHLKSGANIAVYVKQHKN